MFKTVKPVIKRKRVNKSHNKRWADVEIMKLLKYLQERKPEFEKPTAQIFYRKFLETANIDATWDLVRWKVKHLKTSYIKAETWRKSASAGLLGTNEGVLCVQDKLRNICRFYTDLHSIFGQQNSELKCDAVSANYCTTIADSTRDKLINDGDFHYARPEMIVKEEYESMDNQNFSSSVSRCSSTTTAKPLSLSPQQQPEDEWHEQFAKRLKDTSDDISLQAMERNLFARMKFEFEKEKFNKEYDLEERKFAEEIQQRKDNFELKKLEFEKDERLRILELEKQERIERFQIEMRYKYSTQNSN